MIETLLGLAFLLVVLVLVPLLVLKLVFSLALALVLLPFKLIGAAFRVVFGLVALVLKLLFAGLGLVVGALGIVLAVVLAPLLPLLLIGLVFWGLFRLFTRPALARA
jgi:hypothetical protein